jgi:ABC-type transporter Mla subunit MlaD
MKLRGMMSSTNTALKSLDGIKEQLQQIEKTIKERMPDAPKDLAATVSDYLKQTEALLAKLASPQQEGLGLRGSSQLSEKLSSLFSSIQGVNAAPTPAQKEFFDELQPEFQSKLAEVNKFLGEQMPKFNDKLKSNNAPTVVFSKP